MTPIIQLTTNGLDGVADPDAMFGPRLSQEINWAAHDPATLVSNLRGMRLWAYTGNGQAGPLDPLLANPGAAVVETGVHVLNVNWKAAATTAGIPVAYTDYGPGTHTWPYWKRDLRWMIGPLSAVLAQPPAAPALKSYTTVENPWAQWGYHVAIARPAREFSTLSRARCSRLSADRQRQRHGPHPRPVRAGLAPPCADERALRAPEPDRTRRPARATAAPGAARAGQPRPAGHSGRAGRRRDQGLRHGRGDHPTLPAGSPPSPVSRPQARRRAPRARLTMAACTALLIGVLSACGASTGSASTGFVSARPRPRRRLRPRVRRPVPRRRRRRRVRTRQLRSPAVTGSLCSRCSSSTPVCTTSP